MGWNKGYRQWFLVVGGWLIFIQILKQMCIFFLFYCFTFQTVIVLLGLLGKQIVLIAINTLFYAVI